MANKGKKLDLPEAERKRRSELARELHSKRDPITGRPLLGGSQPGAGRPRKKRATERWNELIEEHADEVFQRMLKAMRSGKDMTALMATKQMAEIVKMETEFQVREDKSLDNTPTEELVEIVASRLARLAESGAVPFDIEGYAEESELEALPEGNAGEGSGNGEEDGSEGSVETSHPSSGFGTSAFERRRDEA